MASIVKKIWLTGIVLLLLSCTSDKTQGDDSKENQSDIVITSISPESGDDKTEITITGTGFYNHPNYNSIIVEGKYITPKKATTTSLTFSMPADLVDGDYSIAVKVGSSTATATQKFKLRYNIGDGDFTIPVTARIVSSLIARTVELKSHPRLIFDKAHIDKVKEICAKEPQMNAMLTWLIQQANSILSKPILTYGLDGANTRITSIHDAGNEHLPYLALAYQFTGDKRYAARCWQQLEAMFLWPDWGASRHFLDVGIGSKGCAIAYDCLYDYLSEAQRNQFFAAVKRLALSPGLSQMKGGAGAWKWYLSDNNWNGICHGGLIEAAIAMYEHEPALCADVIANAANRIDIYMKSLNPDGASEEGMMYWSYGLSNTFMAYEAMERNLGSTLGLSQMEGFRKTGWFPYLISGPAGTASLGDDYLYNGVANKYLSFFWFARHFNDANLAKTHYDACLARNSASPNKFNGMLDLLYYDPQLVAQGSQVSQELSSSIRGIDYMHLLESLSADAFYIGMHAGDNDAKHGHLDAGTFYIQAKGENFAVGSLGNTSPYPGNYFDAASPTYDAAASNNASVIGRFSYYRVRTEGKSALVINPDARPEQNPLGVAVTLANTQNHHIVDLAPCYTRDLSHYKRGIAIDRARKAVTVQDEFTLKNTSTRYWLMHTPASDGYLMSGDSRSVTLTKNGKQVIFRILSPASATFHMVNRSESKVNYLSETESIFAIKMKNFDQVNKWYGKLQIKLTGVSGSQTICVECTDVNSQQGTVKALSQW